MQKVGMFVKLDVQTAQDIEDYCYTLGLPKSQWIREVIEHALPELRARANPPKPTNPNRA